MKPDFCVALTPFEKNRKEYGTKKWPFQNEGVKIFPSDLYLMKGTAGCTLLLPHRALAKIEAEGSVFPVVVNVDVAYHFMRI